MVEENPYAGRTIHELKRMDWRNLPPWLYTYFKQAVSALALAEDENAPWFYEELEEWEQDESDDAMAEMSE